MRRRFMNSADDSVRLAGQLDRSEADALDVQHDLTGRSTLAVKERHGKVLVRRSRRVEHLAEVELAPPDQRRVPAHVSSTGRAPNGTHLGSSL